MLFSDLEEESAEFKVFKVFHVIRFTRQELKYKKDVCNKSLEIKNRTIIQ